MLNVTHNNLTNVNDATNKTNSTKKLWKLKKGGWVGEWGGGRNHQHCPILARKMYTLENE